MNNFFDSKHKVISTLLLIAALIFGLYVFFSGRDVNEEEVTGERIPPITHSSVFICDAGAMEVDFADDVVVVRLSDKRQFTLRESTSTTTPGRAFVNSTGVSFVNEGMRATVTENGAPTYSNCNQVSID